MKQQTEPGRREDELAVQKLHFGFCSELELSPSDECQLAARLTLNPFSLRCSMKNKLSLRRVTVQSNNIVQRGSARPHLTYAQPISHDFLSREQQRKI